MPQEHRQNRNDAGQISKAPAQGWLAHAGRAPAETPRATPVAAGDAGRGASGRAGLDADRSTPMDGSMTCGVNLRWGKDETCPLSTGERTRRVQLVQGEGWGGLSGNRDPA